MAEKTYPPAGLLYGILGLLVVNLALTLWIATRETRSTPTAQTSRPPLPSALTKAVRATLFEDIQRYFNAGNFDRIYDIIYDPVKVHLPKARFVEQADRLRGMFGGIGGGAYSHYDYEGAHQGVPTFLLYYPVSLHNKEFSQGRGFLKIRIIDTGEGFGVLGFAIEAA